MKSDNYVVIQGWMCNELGLKGNELLVFALVYGFSRDGASKFSGGRQYIANTFNISLPTVDKALQNLVNRGYLVRFVSNDYINPDTYYVDVEVVKNLYVGGKETLLGGGKETLLNKHTDKNIKEKHINNSKELLQHQPGFLKHDKPQKQSLYSKCVALINAKTEDEKERQLLTDWLKMLLEKYRDRDKQLYVNVFKGKLNTLDSYNRRDWAEVIEYNLQRGYEAFYPVKHFRNDDIKSKPWEAGVQSISQTEEEKREMEEWQEEMRRQGVRVDF